MQVTRAGRPRLKPLPYWTSTRVVLNANKDVVGIERKEDLLGLSQPAHPPQQQQQQQRKAMPTATAKGGLN